LLNLANAAAIHANAAAGANATSSAANLADASATASTANPGVNGTSGAGVSVVNATSAGAFGVNAASAGASGVNGSGASGNSDVNVFHELRSSTDVPSEKREAMELGEQTQAPPFDPNRVCSFSCSGIEPARDGTGQCKVNQDCACICHPFCQDPQCALFCVLDGHGKKGASVSSVAMGHLVEQIETRLMEDEPIVDALTNAFEVNYCRYRYSRMYMYICICIFIYIYMYTYR